VGSVEQRDRSAADRVHIPPAYVRPTPADEHDQIDRWNGGRGHAGSRDLVEWSFVWSSNVIKVPCRRYVFRCSGHFCSASYTKPIVVVTYLDDSDMCFFTNDNDRCNANKCIERKGRRRQMVGLLVFRNSITT